MDVSSLIMEYESSLVKKRGSMSMSDFPKTPNEKLKVVKALLRYIFKGLLNWGPEQIIYFLDESIVEKLGLNPIFSQITFPKSLEKNIRNIYIAHLTYPGKVKFSQKDAAKQTYLMILNQDKKEKLRYPKGFFDEEEGRINANICLLTAINEASLFEKEKNIQGIYSFFADREKALAFFSKMNLISAYETCYGTPVEYVHEALPRKYKDDFWYSYYNFAWKYEATRMRFSEAAKNAGKGENDEIYD